MSNIQLVTNQSEILKDEWHLLLSESSTANFFHTPEAFQFYESSIIGDPFFFAVIENSNLVGLFLGVVLAESGVKSFFSKRAICFGGPVLDDSITDSALHLLLETALKELQKKSIFIEIRNFNDYSNYKKTFAANGFEYQAHLNFHVDCTTRSSMEKRMSSSKLRQIRKSFKEGAEIIEATNKKQVHQFYQILKDLYKTRVKTPLLPESFFLTFFEQKVGKYLLVQFNGEIVGGIMCPIFGSRVIYEWFVCGKDGVHNNVYPSILATWAAMDYANTHGIERFDFMGAGTPDEDYGVREFKSKFGGELMEHGRFVYICKPWLYKLGTLAVSIFKRKK